MEVVIMVGLPSCGKTTYAKKHYPSHVLISLNQLKYNRKKERKVIEENLNEGKSIVIDDINPTKEVRRRHIELAKMYNARIIAVHLDYPLQFVIHRNMQRGKRIPLSAIYKWDKMLVSPSYYEGFDEIIKVKI